VKETLDFLERFIKTGVEDIRSNIMEDPEEDWEPVLFLLNEEENKISPIELTPLFTDELRKDFAAEVAIPAAIRETGATAMGMLASAWMVKISTKGVDPEKEECIDMLVPPSAHPGRVENLIMFLADQETIRFLTAEIKRYEGKPPELGEWVPHPEADGATGRMYEAPLRALRGEE
jgi:hypothetical protein